MPRLFNSLRRFLVNTDGAGSILNLYILATMAVLLGIGLDSTNGWRNKTFLSSVSDVGAHAGAVAIANGLSDKEIVQEVRRVVETNLPPSQWGKVLDASADVRLAKYDIETKFVE